MAKLAQAPPSIPFSMGKHLGHPRMLNGGISDHILGWGETWLHHIQDLLQDVVMVETSVC